MFRSWIGISGLACALVVVVGAITGAAVSTLLPAYRVSAFFTFPGQTVEWATFKRMQASYRSPVNVWRFLENTGTQATEEGRILYELALRPGFLDGAMTPVFRSPSQSLRDAKDDTSLLGAEIALVTRSGEFGPKVIDLLAKYVTNSLVWEQTRDWILTRKFEALSAENQLRAMILRSELDIALLNQRASDMKAILAKYPDSSRLETRQMVTLNPTESGARFLAPLAQLVSFESAISQNRESIRRMERTLQQRQLTHGFFLSAEKLCQETPIAESLLRSLYSLVRQSFKEADQAQEWVKESMLMIYGTLDGFSAGQHQFALQPGSVRADRLGYSSPLRLAAVGAAIALAALAFVALVRFSARALNPQGGSA